MDNNLQRAFNHDYRSRCIYMITLMKPEWLEPYCHISGVPASPDIALTDTGLSVTRNVWQAKRMLTGVEIWRYAVMPDHVHILMYVTQDNGPLLGTYVKDLKWIGTGLLRKRRGFTPESQLYERGYHDRILWRRGQLTAMRNYIVDNPRRYLVKRRHPELFRKGVMITADNRRYRAFGNFLLLEDTDRIAVRWSRSYTEQQWNQLVRRYAMVAHNRGVLVSPFIHPKEKEIAIGAVEMGARLIKIVDYPFGDRFAPKGMDFELCSEGRLLLVSEYDHYGRVGIWRERAQNDNALARVIAERNVTLVTGVR